MCGLLAAGCSASAPRVSPPAAAAEHSVADGHRSSESDPLDRVAAIHGGAGPWVVSGYRMGAFALGQLGLKQGSFDLEVIHHSPRQVQYSCVADGAAAATGASLGKLNLSLEEAKEADLRTTYRRKSTGQTITLRPSRAFVERYKDVPRERLGDAGREVLGLPDDQVFEVVRGSAPP